MKTKRDTSDEVALLIYKELVDVLGVGVRILEPSAGTGTILDKIKSSAGYKEFDCIELNNEKCEILKAKGYNLIGRDYLNTIVDQDSKYDLIVACPPFKDDICLEHIQKMYTELNYMGTIVTLCNTKWLYDNTEKSIKFREFLSSVSYTMKMLPDNSFIEKYKTVPTLLLKIKAPY